MSACENEVKLCLGEDAASEMNDVDVARWNRELADMSAEQRVAAALESLPGPHVVSSSFGAQAAVSLHMLTRQQPDIPRYVCAKYH